MEIDLDELIELGDDVEKENALGIRDQQITLKRLPDKCEHELSTGEKRPKHSCFSQATANCVTANTNVLHKRIPISGDYVPITFSDGTRYYISVGRLQDQPEKLIPSFTASGLAVEAHNLLLSRRMKPASENRCSTVASIEESSELWTVKHSPSHYLDLISDETTNRTLLRWLKAWDSYVFGYSSTYLASTKPRIPSSINTSANNPFPTPTRFIPRADELELTAGSIDPRDGLPRYRILLLTGPPGIGKTTLAHKLAQHAGYQVIEVNASDDRSVSTFKDQLAAVVSTVSTLNRSTGAHAAGNQTNSFKPSCLVLDEIDGAVPGAVELLVAAAQALPQSRNQQQQTRRSRKRPSLLLRRPVICICNDFYSPAVRPLRAPGVPCLVLKLANPDLGRLVARLDAVAREEGLSVDKITLSHLAEMANHDVRACLNALQFIKSRRCNVPDSESTTSLDLPCLASLSGGVKDVQKSLLDAWKSVFTIPSHRVLVNQISATNRLSLAQRTGSSVVPDSDKSLAARVQHIKDIVDAVGETQSLILGIFENYLQARMKDASLNVARQASNWFVYNDLLARHVYSHADYILMRYLVWLPSWFHLALATPLGLSTSAGGRPGASGGIRWPTAHTESATSRSRSLAVVEQLIVNQWQSFGSRYKTLVEVDSRTASLHFLSHRDLLLDLLPNAIRLVTLIASSLRPLNAQLYSQQEKQDLASLVDAMLSLGLDWRVQQTDAAAVESADVDYQLEPPIHEIVSVGCDNMTLGSKVIPFTTKQLIARELRFERMRRSDYSLHSKHQNTTTNTTYLPTTLVTRKLPTHKMELPTASALAVDDEARKLKVKRDFFGRTIPSAPKAEATTDRSINGNACVDQDPSSQLVYYRFQEGYSNAVRRPVTMKQLL